MLSEAVRPDYALSSEAPVLLAVRIDRDNPLHLEFVVDEGSAPLMESEFKEQTERMIRYFLAALAVPEQDIWVNLSPYEKERIISEALSTTEMGRDLLEEDYRLKQLTASLLSPQGDHGREFWKRLRAGLQESYGTSDIPLDMLNKVWIIPGRAVVYENLRSGAACVLQSDLKVLLEKDYYAGTSSGGSVQPLAFDQTVSDVLRARMLPVIEKEVNKGADFARLRQIYNALILAVWYKDRIRDSALSRGYADQGKTGGIDFFSQEECRKIWQKYVESFLDGRHSSIEEYQDLSDGDIRLSKYFSGGWSGRVVLDYAQSFLDFLPGHSLKRISVYFKAVSFMKKDVLPLPVEPAWEKTPWKERVVLDTIEYRMYGLLQDRLQEVIFPGQAEAVLEKLRRPLSYMLENYMQHEYIEGQQDIYWRVRLVPFRQDVIVLELLGPGKYDLPRELAYRLTDVRQPPWLGRAPDHARSSGTGRGEGVVRMLRAFEQLREEVPCISSIYAGWRPLQEGEWPRGIDLMRAGQGNIAAVYFSFRPDFSGQEDPTGSPAASETKGGVDFNSVRIRSAMRPDTGRMNMPFSAETFERLLQADGVVPVIVNVSPLKNLADFSP